MKKIYENIKPPKYNIGDIVFFIADDFVTDKKKVKEVYIHDICGGNYLFDLKQVLQGEEPWGNIEYCYNLSDTEENSRFCELNIPESQIFASKQDAINKLKEEKEETNQ